MKKKYPKDWTNVVFQYMESWKTYTVNRGRFLTFAESEAIAFLDYMDAAGMLAPIPEPLEIEYCTEHNSECVNGYACKYISAPPLNSDGCKFIKLREVEK